MDDSVLRSILVLQALPMPENSTGSHLTTFLHQTHRRPLIALEQTLDLDHALLVL